ncbi:MULTISPECIES: hypothetical protein [Bacillus cereus group]|uniref:hypothetical protein n=1 Tax=Bacillus cereus group TaxID=86661 RepID=UPI0005CEBF3E|nr:MULTISPECIES: hypothetical protein [Bacillus cereus group]
MDKFFCTVGLVFCILLAFSGIIDLVQNEIMKAMVVGMLAPLKKWYVALPLGICLLGFNTSLIYKMLNENSEKSKQFLVIFSLGGFMIYMTASLFSTVNEIIKGL